MAEKSLAAVGAPATSLPSPAEWTNIFDMAEKLVPTGFLPESIKTPAQAAAVMLKGRELGIPPMYALSNIAVIKGKPTCGAELMLALIYRDHGDNAIQFPETSSERCTIAYRRRGWDKAQTYSFTMQDAQRASLTTNTWRQYPAAMLRARCISAVARMAFADSIGGMYTPEELGAVVTVVDEQVVVDSTAYVVDEAEIVVDHPRPVYDNPATVPADFEPQQFRDQKIAESKQRDAARQDTPERRANGLAKISELGREKGLNDDEITALAVGYLGSYFTVETMDELTTNELISFYDYLNANTEENLIERARVVMGGAA